MSSFDCVGYVSYVINEAAREYQNSEKARRKPEMPEARRLQGASIEAKNVITVKTRAIR